MAGLAALAGSLLLPIRAAAIVAMAAAVLVRAVMLVNQERATRHPPDLDDYVALSMIRRLAY